eukprot:m.8108 g.8108  ORF g.8108 m.8108 type:complete len:454 (+) comp3841_c0_seq2:49-1410(+)
MILFMLLTAALSTGAQMPSTFLYNPRDLMHSIAILKANSSQRAHDAYESLIHSALELLPESGKPWSKATGPWSVMNKTLSIPNVSKHNYISIGIYNHPCNNLPKGCKAYPGGHLLPPQDCDNTTGLPWEPCDGLRNMDAINMGDAPSAGSMMNAVGTLSMSSFFCMEDKQQCQRFAERAAHLLRVFFLENETMMYPNLYFGQIDPKSTPPNKGHGGFIEWTELPFMLDHVAMLRYAAPDVWTSNDHEQFEVWVSQFLEYVNGAAAKGERDMTNNHGTWYDNTWQGVALHALNSTQADQAAQEVMNVRIATQIKGDGKEWIELERTNPAGYCMYNLQALTNNADQYMTASGKDDIWKFTNKDGGNIRKAIDFLVQFATGGMKWPYKQIEPPTWGGLFASLRRASRIYQNEQYEIDACKVSKGSGIGKQEHPWLHSSYRDNVFDLLVPPMYNITC